ncbi:MAG: VWA domain-containing protein [Burkholderiales bacterium]|nr:VWA domain-containing protein [Burkholderiales bacterium]
MVEDRRAERRAAPEPARSPSGDRPAYSPAEGHHLAENLVHFGRVLRTAGLPVSTDRLLLAAQALQAGGLASRADFKATLATCLVDRPEHRPLFEQTFHVFWRDPDLLGRIMALLLPQAQGRAATPPPPENRRLGEALFPAPAKPQPPRTEQLDIDARLDLSDRERLQQRDFDTMTAAEWAAARRVLAGLQPRLAQRLTRRHEAAPRGRIDWRATLRAEARRELAAPPRERPRRSPAPLVLLADISGSMGRYSRVLLHLAQGLLNPGPGLRERPVVEAFVFGTRLTRITRQLKARDPDAALAAVSAAVPDWAGGTRISASLHAFNRDWARRMPAGATVLLVTDGLERGADDDPGCACLAFEAERLRLSCRELIWLNPLLRYTAFQPRAAGVQALLPEVSRHLPVHDLDSVERLLASLAPGR